MKLIIVMLYSVAFIGCSSTKDIQVEMVEAELVKIDTVFRHPIERKLLTWRCRDNVEYICFVSMEETHSLGKRMMVMRQR